MGLHSETFWPVHAKNVFGYNFFQFFCSFNFCALLHFFLRLVMLVNGGLLFAGLGLTQVSVQFSVFRFHKEYESYL